MDRKHRNNFSLRAVLFHILICQCSTFYIPPSSTSSIIATTTTTTTTTIKHKGKIYATNTPENELLDFNFMGQALNIITDKTFDTLEDAALMFQRKVSEASSLEKLSSFSNNEDSLSQWNVDRAVNTTTEKNYKKRVVVIGSGWASHAFIKVIDTDAYRVLVISPYNYFVFTPMLASSSVGTTEIRSIVESTRDSNPYVNFLEGKGIGIDTKSKTITVRLGKGDIIEEDNDKIKKTKRESQEIIPYDICVFAPGVGPILSSSERSKHTPGLSKENVYFLKTVNDARRLRSAVIDVLEKASQPNLTEDERKRMLTFVIVGGGPTGVEYCGELTDFLNDVTGKTDSNDGDDNSFSLPFFNFKRSITPFVSLAKYIRIILLQSGKELLPMFDEDLREFARTGLQDRGVEVQTDTIVSEIKNKETIIIEESYDDGDDSSDGKKKKKTSKKQEIECGMIIWAAGTMPVKITETLLSNIDSYHIPSKDGGVLLPSSLSRQGRIPVDRWQRVIGDPHSDEGSLFAIGDASGTVDDNMNMVYLPQTAQVAAQQGAYTARLLNRGYDLGGGVCFREKGNSNETKNNITGDFFFSSPPTPPINKEAQKGDLISNIKIRGVVRAKPFEFLNLGLLAYTGGGEALSQVQFGESKLFSRAGSVGFLLWRSVYVVKQVSTKTRVLVIFDWVKTRLFGRDVTRN